MRLLQQESLFNYLCHVRRHLDDECSICLDFGRPTTGSTETHCPGNRKDSYPLVINTAFVGSTSYYSSTIAKKIAYLKLSLWENE